MRYVAMPNNRTKTYSRKLTTYFHITLPFSWLLWRYKNPETLSEVSFKITNSLDVVCWCISYFKIVNFRRKYSLVSTYILFQIFISTNKTFVIRIYTQNFGPMAKVVQFYMQNIDMQNVFHLPNHCAGSPLTMNMITTDN